MTNVRTVAEADLRIVHNRQQHNMIWRDRPDSYWLARLVEEVGELAAALEGRHEHTPELELEQIGGIVINWLEKRQYE